MNTTQCPECRSTNVSRPDPHDSIDCLDCGIFFDPEDPHNQPDHPLFGHPLLDGPPALLYCVICDENLRDSTPTTPPVVIARWHDQNICTDCLAYGPGTENAAADARGERQPMTQQAYRDTGGGACPHCQSGNVLAGRMTVEAGIVGQRMRCVACDLTWTAMYRLAGYVREAGTPAGKADWHAFLATEVIETAAQEGT